MMKTALKIDAQALKTKLLNQFLWLKPAIKQLAARIEVQFWAMITYWMSESSLVQAWVVQAYLLKARLSRQGAHLLRRAMIWVGAGWLAGLLFGILGF